MDVGKNFEMHRISVKYKYLMTTAYLYLAIPIIIFYFGWMKSGYSIILSAMLCIGLVFVLKEYYLEDRKIEIPAFLIILAVFFAVFWVYSSGVGGYYPQKTD